jgi:hypothetical protein
MAVLIVKSEQEAIDVSRILTRAAKPVSLDAALHSIEQTVVTDWLFAIRDSVKIEGAK